MYAKLIWTTPNLSLVVVNMGTKTTIVVVEVSRVFSFKARYNSAAFSIFHSSDVYDINDPTRRKGK